MNRRQKKKLIPKDTDYCYKITSRDEGGSLSVKRCPFYKIIGYQDDAIIDAQGQEHPCQTPIHYCSYAKVSSEEDFLLSDQVKTCGERLGKVAFY